MLLIEDGLASIEPAKAHFATFGALPFVLPFIIGCKTEDRAFTVRGDGNQAVVLDHESSKPEKVDPAVIAQFTDLDIAAGDTLIAFGWAMTEDLEKLL